ncbi:hypothetical protein JCM10449v2_005610 [Rhodotorula kratochvilovae]
MSAPLDSPNSVAKEFSSPSMHGATPSHTSTIVDDSTIVDKPAPKKKDARFWFVFVALCFCCFLSALDLTAVSTALPSIAADFESSDFSWVGSAYALTSTALIPWTGGLAAIFGRRPVMVAALVLFALGSALTGAGQNMAMVIAGRSVQGIGGGAILTMTEIIVCDLVPLNERGAYFGIIGAVWALASAIGPPIGGALASAGAWRWLFYLNLPLTGLALALVMVCLNVKSPKTTLKEKLALMDYANVIFVASSTATILGLTWGGTTYSWSSFRVLVPLILGIVGMIAFVLVERSFVKHPTVPFDILRHRNSWIGFLTTFLHSVCVMALMYFLPTYFQMRGDSAIQSGVKLFPLSFTVAPLAIAVGISVTVTGHYWVQNLVGWLFAIVGYGLLTLLKADSSRNMWAGFTVIIGMGLGMLYAATNFPVLAPLKPSQQPHAVRRIISSLPAARADLAALPQITFFGFVRSFGQVFGIAIGSTIFSNELTKNLPEEFASQFGEMTGDIAYALIPQIKTLAEPLRSDVQAAFADSLRTIWQVLIGVAGLGLVVSVFMQSLPLTTEMDEENWGLKEKEKKAGGEKGREEEKVGA